MERWNVCANQNKPGADDSDCTLRQCATKNVVVSSSWCVCARRVSVKKCDEMSSSGRSDLSEAIQIQR
ncbi:unnamed protein product [Anisakis simplex]|uniref:EB domain-containing protein n=1 Tax=Anisakis simplex TaxID=6269 RepID=A0A0M3IXX7_ANISI|nr:unnamed protein product [Anisakis simplex]